MNLQKRQFEIAGIRLNNKCINSSNNNDNSYNNNNNQTKRTAR